MKHHDKRHDAPHGKQGKPDDIPTLTDVVPTERAAARLSAQALADLHAELTARVERLTGELVHNASREIEALLQERIRDQLRAQLPELVEQILRARRIK